MSILTGMIIIMSMRKRMFVLMMIVAVMITSMSMTTMGILTDMTMMTLN